MIEGESRMRVKHKKRMKRVLAMILTAAITLQTGFSPVASAATGSETAKAGSSTVEMDSNTAKRSSMENSTVDANAAQKNNTLGDSGQESKASDLP